MYTHDHCSLSPNFTKRRIDYDTCLHDVSDNSSERYMYCDRHSNYSDNIIQIGRIDSDTHS